MKIVFTKHASLKLQEKEPKLLKITRKKIIEVIKNPIEIDKSIHPHRNVGKLNQELSLCVIYKIENMSHIVITFYPAEKGRYESKVLQRR